VKNLGTIDRLVRVFLAELCILVGFFWTGGAWQIVLYLIAAVMAIQASTGVCGLYNLIGWNTCERIKRKDKNLVTGTVALIVMVAGVGSYGSAIMTKNILIEEISSLEQPCNYTLLYTGLDQRNESISHYEQFNITLTAFDKKYSDYRPLALKYDKQFPGDVQNLSMIVKASKQDIYNGQLSDAHRSLEEAEPIIQGMKIRNGLE
jgi:hypothetical protein